MPAITRPPVAAADLHAAFLAELPRFAAHARLATRHVACPDTRADLVAETLALAWRQFARLHRRGKDPGAFVTTLALRCSQAVRAGRRLVRSDGARDALSPVARARHGFAVERLPHPRCDAPHLATALADDTRTPVPDQAAFRLDFPRWRAGFRPRTRAVLDALAVGGRTGEVARRFGLSQGRVSQLRRVFAVKWKQFHEVTQGRP
jgi:DNA-directed RNA polymerase specialized sigma24 family protein